MDDRLSNKVLKSSDRLNQEEKSTNSERSELRTKFL
jgi:hypothetical protein